MIVLLRISGPKHGALRFIFAFLMSASLSWGGLAGLASAQSRQPAAVDSPVLPLKIEAESGQRGELLEVATEQGVGFLRSTSKNDGQSPGTAKSVASFKVRFARAGRYELYARVRVGPAGVLNDSFFFATSLGKKDPAAEGDWLTANSLGQIGYTAEEDIVGRGGAPVSGRFHWVNLSSFVTFPKVHTYEVKAGELTQVFQIGGREAGLDIDALVFGPATISHTVRQLQQGEAGRYIPPKPPPAAFLPMGPALGHGKSKYLGGVHSAAQLMNFDSYFNQVVPENAGKWGSVEAVRDVMVWDELDAAYQFAKQRKLPFRMHVMVWGNQQPAWIESLPRSEQRAEIEQWFEAVAKRYPDLDYVEVVNEPLHDPPNQRGNGGGNYIKALGGAGKTGWDWILTAFRLARWHFPKSKLVLNDYSIINTPSDARRYRNIVELLKTERLVDAVGIQCHGFSTTVPVEVMRKNLDQLARSGLPLLVTELDIDGTEDAAHLAEYQRVFPLLWEHPAVVGITFWGYRPGMWRTPQGAYLAHDNGAERPALQWLRGYVQNDPPTIVEGQAFVVSETLVPGSAVGTIEARDLQGVALRDFEILKGEGADLFDLDPNSGRLALRTLHSLDFETTRSYHLKVVVRDDYSQSAPVWVRVQVRNKNDSPPSLVTSQSFSVDRAPGGLVGRIRASDPDDIRQPGFSDLGGFQIVGGSGAGLFEVNAETGHLSIVDPARLDYQKSRYRLEVVVRDGSHTSIAGGVEILIATQLRVCRKGHTQKLARSAIAAALRRGAQLGPCAKPRRLRGSPGHSKPILRGLRFGR